MDQLRWVKLPQLLDLNGLTANVLSPALEWPLGDTDDEARHEGQLAQFADIEQQVRSALRIRLSADKSEIEAKLAGSAVCYCFDIGIELDDWSEAQTQLIRHWIHWWNEIDYSRVSVPIITIFRIGFPPGLISRLWRQRALKAILRDLQGLAKECSARATVCALPKFERVRFEDVDRWIRETAENIDREVLRRLVRERFACALCFGRRRLSMQETADMLKALWNHPGIRVTVP